MCIQIFFFFDREDCYFFLVSNICEKISNKVNVYFSIFMNNFLSPTTNNMIVIKKTEIQIKFH